MSSKKMRKTEVRRRRIGAASQAEQKSQSSFTAWIWPCLILAGVIIGYGNTLRVPFFFDDLESIPENSTIRNLVDSWSPRSAATVTGRPLLNFTFALNYAIGGLSVIGYHLLNIAIHLLNGLLLYVFVHRTLLMPRIQGRFTPTARWIAGVSSILWVLHPLVTEAVTYTVQRSESLSALWILATATLFATGMQSPRPLAYLIASLFTALLGTLTKETSAVLPLLLLAYDWIFISDSFASVLKKRGAYYLGLFATWGILIPLVLSGRHGTAGFGLDVSPIDYLRTQAGVIAHYLYLAVIPYPLVIDYGWPIAKSLAQVPPWGVVTVACFGLTCYALLLRKPEAFAGVWLFLLLAPSSSLIPVVTEVAAERRMYLPAAGLVVLAVSSSVWWLTSRNHNSKTIPVSCWVASLCIALAFSVLTVRRNAQYQNPTVLWAEAVALYPQNARAHYNLALAMETAGKFEPALQGYLKAIEKDETKVEAYTNAALLLSRTGRTSDALELSRKAQSVRPDFAPVYSNLGMILSSIGDTTGALKQYELALQKDANSPDGHYNAGNTLASMERFEEAEKHYREAVRVKPDFAAALSNLGNILMKQNRIQEAEQQFRSALNLKPEMASAHFNLGIIMMQTGRNPEARKELELALKYNPNLQQARAALQDLAGSM